MDVDHQTAGNAEIDRYFGLDDYFVHLSDVPEGDGMSGRTVCGKTGRFVVAAGAETLDAVTCPECVAKYEEWVTAFIEQPRPLIGWLPAWWVGFFSIGWMGSFLFSSRTDFIGAFLLSTLVVLWLREKESEQYTSKVGRATSAAKNRRK